MKKKGSILFVLIFLFICCSSVMQAQQTFSFAAGKIKHRLMLGPVFSLYKNHPQMTTDTKARIGFTAGYKLEFFMGHRTNLLFGLDFLSQHFTFRGYYNSPGFTYLFDKTFAYTHDVRFTELQSPVSLKVDFNSEKENGVSPYFIGGIGIRYITSAYSVVMNDSTGISPYDGKITLGFEHQYITRGFNFFYQAGLGLQRNRRDSGKALFFELNFKYGLSRLYYTGHDNSNDLGIRNSMISIVVGFRI